MSLRSEKVSSVIRRILAEAIRIMGNEAGAGLVSVTSVKMTNDLQVAKIYVSAYGGRINSSGFVKYLEIHQGELRKRIGEEVRLRRVPELRFFIDDTLEEMERIKSLLQKIEVNNTE